MLTINIPAGTKISNNPKLHKPERFKSCNRKIAARIKSNKKGSINPNKKTNASHLEADIAEVIKNPQIRKISDKSWIYHKAFK